MCGKNHAIFSFLSGSWVNFWTMDEKIIRLCEENNVPSLVQALSTVKNQKVCVIISALVREGAVCKLICIIT